MKKALSLFLSIVLVLGVFLSVPFTGSPFKITAEAASNIIINNIDIGYANGSYFTKNGKSCSNSYWANGRCHNNGVCESTANTQCNCMRYWPTGKSSTCKVDLKASQCFGFARYCQWIVYGYHDGSNTSEFKNLGSLSSSSCTASKLKEMLLNCAPATHVRTSSSTKGYAHSISIISTSDDGANVADCNSDGYCKVRYKTYSWSELATFLKGYGGVSYAYSYASYSAKHTHSYISYYEAVHPHKVYEKCSCGDWYYTGETREVNTCSSCIHAHSYSTYFEATHPHRVYKKCSCGDWYYTGETREVNTCSLCIHAHSYSTYFEAIHPHKVYKECSCGDWYYTGETREVNTCSSCWYASFNVSTSSIYLEVGESKSITVSVSGCLPDTHVLSYSYKSNLVNTSTSSGTVTFTGLAPGTFDLKLYVYSDSSKSHLINSMSIPVTITTTNYTGKVSFDKSSITLVMPTKNTDTLTINLSGTWPAGAGYLFDYDEDIISLSQNGTALTITAKKEGITDFSINIVDQNNNNSLITSASCRIKVTRATCILNFDANGGTEAPDPIDVAYGMPISLSYECVRSGYEFLGWSKYRDSTVPQYFPGDEFVIYEDTLLYAVWKPITLTRVKCGPPNKIGYFIGDSLDTSGLKLYLEYSDGSTKVIDSGYTVSGFSSSTTGEKTVTVSYGGKTDDFKVYIETPTVSLSKTTIAMNIGDSSTLTVTTAPGGQSVKWISSNTNVVAVSNGTITAKAAGTETITAMFTYNGFTYSETCSVTVTKPVHTHTVSNWITDKAATCTIAGSKHKVCIECGETLETQTILATGHTASNWITDRAATCTIAGSKHKACTVCGKTLETQTIPTTGHTASNWMTDKASTCMVAGSKHKACTVCGKTLETEAIPATGHTSSDWVTDKAATVNAAGSQHKECTECGEVLETAVIPQLKPSDPTLSKAANANDGVTVTWKAVSGADSYRVYRKTSSSGWTCLNSKVTSTSYTDKTAKSGTTYYYTVRAENKAGLSGYNSTGVSVKYLAMPTVTIANASTGVKVSWNKITGASKYYVYRKASGENSWTRLTDSATGTSYTDTKAKSGTTYYYTVKAVSGSVASASKSSSALKYLAQPSVTVSNENSGITVKWNKITGASGYYVYRKTGSGSWSLIYTVKSGSTVSYTDKSAKAGTTYYYTVRAYSGSVKSTFTSSTAIRRLTTPTLKSVSSAKSGITFKWNKVTGASGYYVYRKTGSGGWQKIATVKSGSTVSYLDKTAKKGTTYTYTVKAYYSSSSVSYFNTTGLKIKDKY